MKAKKRMQQVSFRSVDEFLDFLPGEELRVVKFLRTMIFDCIPGVEEKLSYNVPYYRKNKTICFIWPASVLWGNKPSYTGVRFGFTSGYMLQDSISYLNKGERKQVYWKDFNSINEIDVELLKAYIFEAVLIDEAFNKKTGG